MEIVTNEKQARYKVVSLLDEGRINEAEKAFAHFCKTGLIYGEYEMFYRCLLEAALDASSSPCAADEAMEERSVIDHKQVA